MTVPPDSEDLTVKIGGQVLDGWTGVRVTRGIERLPSGCALELTERFPGAITAPALAPGLACQVYLGPDLVLTGYVNLYWPHEDAGSHVVRVEARSKTQDIVDCSLAPPSIPPWSVSAATLGPAAEQYIKKPFGIDYVLPADGDPSLISLPNGVKPPVFPINPGETVAELFEEMTRTIEVLMWDDPQGRVVFSKVGTKRAGSPLVEGVNCEIGEARLSDDKRYSDIYVVSQAQPVIDTMTAHFNYFAHAPDGEARSYRPKLIVMDAWGSDLKFPQQRANWEVARRRGRSMIVDVTVTGWRDGSGDLWAPNTITRCTLPSLKIDRDLLIAEVAWMRGEAGTTTLLALMPPEGFQPQPFYFNPFPGAVLPNQPPTQ